ncbi:MAG: hypothetical protein ACXVZV_04715 [Terriglobales bacterium]
MFAVVPPTLMTFWTAQAIATNVPFLQLILGIVGLSVMISYAISRQKIRKQSESQQRHVAALLLRHVGQWLGDLYGGAGHAKAGGR